ncbi:uncharacterized protein LOC121992059 isoform X1 [Zingiber officinale]|uniref:uncharacterized protein LOC121992059 isoform X1 n=1 Tax=Zingiber officinale TaxID=94328 RepID=UPI001C4C7F32|nr:uncharacterized protein LOC121992059 isoform X1 [Zingiber officinale]
MACCASIPSCTLLRVQSICCETEPLFVNRRNIYARVLGSWHLRKVDLISQFRFSTPFLANVFFGTSSKTVQCMKKSSPKCFGVGMLITPKNSVADNWIPIVDQMLLTISVIFAYLAGVVPKDRTFPNVGSNTAGPSYDAATSSNGRSTESISNNYWHEISGKLMDALSTIKDDHAFSTKVYEDLYYSKRSPLNMFAINEGPRLRLIWVTLQQLQNKVNAIPENSKFVTRDVWLKISSKIVTGVILPVCTEWLRVEHDLEIGESNVNLPSKIIGKLKEDDRILQNINRVGKIELYSDLIFFLRFGSPSPWCCCDSKLLPQHGADILEDMIVMLADTIASIYVEVISIDSDIFTEMNVFGLTLCSMSTRTLQKLRNEVLLNQWLQENFESVISMYEDRFELHILQRELFDNPEHKESSNLTWWKNLPFKKSAVPSLVPYVCISQFSLPVKRMKELRALTGWRYCFSLYLEFCDISMPFFRAAFNKVSKAVSFLLVCMIGRSVGLIFSGIRQSLGWR